MHIVLDTNVLISAALWDGSVAQKLLSKLLQPNIKIFSSMEILSEYQKVLKYDKHLLNIKELEETKIVKPEDIIALI